jgi:hypothetical protein
MTGGQNGDRKKVGDENADRVGSWTGRDKGRKSDSLDEQERRFPETFIAINNLLRIY